MRALGNSIRLELNPKNKDQREFDIKERGDFQNFMSVLYTLCKQNQEKPLKARVIINED